MLPDNVARCHFIDREASSLVGVRGASTTEPAPPPTEPAGGRPAASESSIDPATTTGAMITNGLDPLDVPQPISKSDVPHTPCTAGSNRAQVTAPAAVPLRVGVTMSMHKLTAGSGHDYLTRQVAALDATEKGHTGLSSYYTAG